MELLRKLLLNRRLQGGVVVLFLAMAASVVVASKMGVDPASLKGIWKAVESYLKLHPAALFWALVILPGLPIPSSALMLMAGVVWRQQPVMACGLYLLAMVMNLTWTYWLAAGPARRLVERMLAATEIQIPDLPRGDHLKLILVLKLTPGIPFFLQNYLLGFLRAPFHLYLPISILCNGIIGSGIVLGGAGLSDGRLMPALTGISLIVLGIVLTHLVRGWMSKRKQAKECSSDISA